MSASQAIDHGSRPKYFAATWSLTKVRMLLAMRNRTFFFFSLMMPMLFLIALVIFVGRHGGFISEYALGDLLTLTVMGSFWGLSVQLVTFREQGILRRFRVAPVGPGAMLASSILSNYILTLPTVAIEFVLARRIFHMNQWGNLGGVFFLITLGIVTFASLGLIIASVTIPLPMLPIWIQRFALFLPATYLVTGLERVMVGRVGVTQIFPEIVALAVSAALAFFLSQQLFRWEPEAKVGPRAKVLATATIVPFLLLGFWEIAHGGLRAARTDFLTIERPAAPNTNR